MDGNFGLVRKRQSGQSYQPPLFNDLYFVDSKQAEKFVNEYDNDKTSDKVSA